MQGLWRMSGLEHHNIDRLCGSLVHIAETLAKQIQIAFTMRELRHPLHDMVDGHNVPHLATMQLDQHQQQIIVSQGFIWAIQTGHLLNRIKSKTL